MEVRADVKVDDSKVHIIRGPQGCRQVAMDAVASRLQQLLDARDKGFAIALEDISDLEQTLKWLQQLKVE